jgi:hypothetical protein
VVGIYAIPDVSVTCATEEELTAQEGAVRDRDRALQGNVARFDPRRRIKESSRCCSIMRMAGSSIATASAAARLS